MARGLVMSIVGTTLAGVWWVWLAPASPPAEGPQVVSGAAEDPEQGWTVARTPWGDPDLQGIWDTRTRTPLERPAEFGMREFMTDQEWEERLRRGQLNFASGDEDDGGDAADEKLAEALRDSDQRKAERLDQPDDGRPGYRIAGAEYNAFWFADPTDPTLRKPSLRTSQIVDPPDGRMPPLTRQMLEKWDAREEARRHRSQGDDWEDRGISERCIVRQGLPGEMIGSTQYPNLEIVQAPGYLSLVMSFGYVRTIPLDARPHLGPAIRQWNGDSRGHWEGTTLVVETTNFKNHVKNVIPGHGSPFGGNVPGLDHVHYYGGSGETLRLLERFTRIDAETIEYRYTVDDPEVFVGPWSVVTTFNLDRVAVEGKQDRIYEYACHEHNYGMVNALLGNRADRAWALAEAAREASVRQKERAIKWEQLRKWKKAKEPRR